MPAPGYRRHAARRNRPTFTGSDPSIPPPRAARPAARGAARLQPAATFGKFSPAGWWGGGEVLGGLRVGVGLRVRLGLRMRLRVGLGVGLFSYSHIHVNSRRTAATDCSSPPSHSLRLASLVHSITKQEKRKSLTPSLMRSTSHSCLPNVFIYHSRDILSAALQPPSLPRSDHLRMM